MKEKSHVALTKCFYCGDDDWTANHCERYQVLPHTGVRALYKIPARKNDKRGATMTPLKLTAYEQSALAELAGLMAGISYQLLNGKPMPENVGLRLEHIALSYDKAHWGMLYDKLHRTGENF